MSNKYKIILIFNISLTLGQNYFYKPDDWYILSSLGSIKAITEDNNYLYFISNNGVYKYDKNINDLIYDYNLSTQFDFNGIIFFIYDKYRDYFWCINKEGVSFKSAISSVWREKDFDEYDIYSPSNIMDIGISPQNIWIKYYNQNIQINPFNGNKVQFDITIDEINLIEWNSVNNKNKDQFKISDFVIDDDSWNIGLEKIYRKDGVTLNPSFFWIDYIGNVWIGTQEGYILSGDLYTKKLKIIKFGIQINDLLVAYFDEQNNWWFADNFFKRKNFSDLEKQELIPFLTSWNENNNTWQYYYSNESNIIGNTDINKLFRKGNQLLIATMDGLLAYDIKKNDWLYLNEMHGLNDPTIWDMIEFENSLYMATSKGINILSNYKDPIISNNKEFSYLESIEIYDLEKDSNYLYISSMIGLFKHDIKTNRYNLISNNIFKKIKVENDKIYGLNNQLLLITENKEEIIKDSVYDFAVCNSYIWISFLNRIKLFHIDTGETWEYTKLDGVPGNLIYALECDSEWVWFLTNNGIAFYNWGKYHEKIN